MRTIPYLALGALLLALTGCTSTKQASGPNPGLSNMQTAKRLAFRKQKTEAINYLLFLPKDYHTAKGKRWPLLLFLHGAGERGTNIWKVAVHGPPKIVANQPDFPFIVLSPQCPEGQIWSDDTVLTLLDEIQRKYAVDASRVYLTGLSMGGYGTWSLGLAHPERFAAIVPICGGDNLISTLLLSGARADAAKNLAIWAFHGGKDSVVPLSESQRMVEALKKAGVKEVKLDVYPEAGHDSWTETYNNPGLYDWLLKHERKP